MGKFDGVLLCTDYDDTFCTATGAVPRANQEAVAYFKEQGGLFTVATGRAHNTFAPHVHLAGINAPAVLSNGSQLYDFDLDEMLVDVCLPRSCREELGPLRAAFSGMGMEAYHEGKMYIVGRNAWVDRHIAKVKVTGEETPVGAIPLPWGKAIFMAEHHDLLSVQGHILTRWGEKYEAIFSNPHMLEITAKGCNKGGMVLELARRLGIEKKNIYCVGDNQNDLPMLAVSAIPFAPANCAPEVRDWGARLLCHCEEGTIAALIAELDKIY